MMFVGKAPCTVQLASNIGRLCRSVLLTDTTNKCCRCKILELLYMHACTTVVNIVNVDANPVSFIGADNFIAFGLPLQSCMEMRTLSITFTSHIHDCTVQNCKKKIRIIY